MVSKAAARAHEHSSLWSTTCSLALVAGALPSLAAALEPPPEGPLLLPPAQQLEIDPVTNSPEVRDALLDLIKTIGRSKDVRTLERARLHWQLMSDPIATYIRLLKSAPDVSAAEIIKAGDIAYSTVNQKNHYQRDQPEDEVVAFINNSILSLHEAIIQKALTFTSESDIERSQVERVTNTLKGDLFWSQAHKYEAVYERATCILNNEFLKPAKDGSLTALALSECTSTGTYSNPIKIRLFELNRDRIPPMFAPLKDFSKLSPEEGAKCLSLLLPLYEQIQLSAEESTRPGKISLYRGWRLRNWAEKTIGPSLRDNLISIRLRLDELQAAGQWGDEIESKTQSENFLDTFGTEIHAGTENDSSLASRYLRQIEGLLIEGQLTQKKRIELYRSLAHFSLSFDNEAQLTEFIKRRIAGEKDHIALSEGLGRAFAVLYLRYHLEKYEDFISTEKNLLIDKDVERQISLLAIKARIDLDTFSSERNLKLSGFDGLLRDVICNASLGYDFPTFLEGEQFEEEGSLMRIAYVRENCIHTANGTLSTLNHLLKREYSAEDKISLGTEIRLLTGGGVRWHGNSKIPCGSEIQQQIQELHSIVETSEKELLKLHGHALTIDGQAELIHGVLRIYQTEHVTFSEGKVYRDQKYADLKAIFSRDYRTTHHSKDMHGPFLENYRGARDYLYMKTFKNSADFVKLENYQDKTTAEKLDHQALKFADAQRDLTALTLIRAIWSGAKNDGTTVLVESGSHSSKVRETRMIMQATGLTVVDLDVESDFDRLCNDSNSSETFLAGLEKIRTTTNENWLALRESVLSRDE